jgi:DNA-binding CsgD family transcriptional regulator
VLAQAGALEGYGARRRDDPVRIATLRLEAGGGAQPDLLVRGALSARAGDDLGDVVRLAGAAFDVDPSALAGLLLAEALHDLGDCERAEGVLDRVLALAGGDDAARPAVELRARTRHALGRADPSFADVPAAVRAELLASGGRPLEALDLLGPADQACGTERLDQAVARAAALAVTGRTEDALRLSRAALQARSVVVDPPPGSAAPGAHRINELSALVEAGRLVEASEQGRAWFDAALRARRVVEVTWLAVHLARCALVRGLPISARRWAERAGSALAGTRLDGLRPAVSAVHAAAVALTPVAAPAPTAAISSPTGDAGPTTVERALALGWTLAAGGRRRDASRVLLEAAEAAGDAGLVGGAGWLLHEAVRFGAGELAAPRLADLAASSDGQLLPLRAAHAGALIDADAERLVRVSERFEQIGAPLLAADAAAGAATALRMVGDGRADALWTRTASLAGRCEGATTPAIVTARLGVLLSGREHDIAVRAASGDASRTIADALGVSVRTVDNHLGHIYDKVGVSGRVELTVKLALVRRDDGQS